jgi:hypothetical protein
VIHRQHFPLLSMDDPGPSLASIGVKVRRQARKLQR